MHPEIDAGCRWWFIPTRFQIYAHLFTQGSRCFDNFGRRHYSPCQRKPHSSRTFLHQPKVSIKRFE
jgi:L-ascorbate metabolism protein UlaG (beta-lactamase superfamily)